MTYDNNDERLRSANTPINRRVPVNASAGITPYIFGAIVVALVLAGVFMFTNNNTNTASNQNGTTSTAPVTVTPPASTTGSGSTSPTPARPATPPTSR